MPLESIPGHRCHRSDCSPARAWSGDGTASKKRTLFPAPAVRMTFCATSRIGDASFAALRLGNAGSATRGRGPDGERSQPHDVHRHSPGGAGSGKLPPPGPPAGDRVPGGRREKSETFGLSGFSRESTPDGWPIGQDASRFAVRGKAAAPASSRPSKSNLCRCASPDEPDWRAISSKGRWI